MGSVEDKLNFLKGTKTAIRTSIIDKGGDIPETLPFRQYAAVIDGLEIGGGGSSKTIGEVGISYLSSEPPENCMFITGGSCSKTQYPKLWAVAEQEIMKGNTLFLDEGPETFVIKIPQFPVAWGTENVPGALGAQGGAATHTLVENELPNISGSFALHGEENGTIIHARYGNTTGNTYTGGYKTITTQSTGAHSITSPGFKFGNGQEHNNLPPFTVVNYWICYDDNATPSPMAGEAPIGTVSLWLPDVPCAPGYYRLDGTSVAKELSPTLADCLEEDPENPDNFLLPDWRGRVPVMQDEGTFANLGDFIGEEKHKLTVAELPSHRHGVGVSQVTSTGSAQDVINPTGNGLASRYEGNDEPHNNIQPSVVSNYIVKVFHTNGSESKVNIVGRLENLETEDQSNLVNAINEVNRKVEGDENRAKKTVSGYSFKITDAIEGKVEDLQIKGNTYRKESSLGVNLFNKEDTDKIVVGSTDGSGVFNQESANSLARKTAIIPCQANTDYTISKISSTVFILGTYDCLAVHATPAIYFTTSQLTATRKTFNSGAGAKYIYLTYYSSLTDTISEQDILDSIQVEKGTTATTYEPFTPDCPSLDYPSDLTTVRYNMRNMAVGTATRELGKTFEENKYFMDNRMRTDVLIPVKGLSSFTASIKPNGSTTYQLMIEAFDAGTYYMLSEFFQSDTMTLPLDSTLEYVAVIVRKLGDDFIGASDQEYIRKNLDIKVSVTQPEEFTINVWGDNPTDKTVFKFPLNGLVLDGVEYYRDYLSDDGVHKRTKRFILNGTEDWQVGTVSGGFASFSLDGMSFDNLDRLESNLFKQQDLADKDGIYIDNSKLNIRINSDVLASNTVVAFKDWLSSFPVEVVSSMQTEELIPYTAEQKEVWDSLQELKMLSGDTNINVVTIGADPLVQLTYFVSSQKIMDNGWNLVGVWETPAKVHSYTIDGLDIGIEEEVEIRYDGPTTPNAPYAISLRLNDATSGYQFSGFRNEDGTISAINSGASQFFRLGANLNGFFVFGTVKFYMRKTPIGDVFTSITSDFYSQFNNNNERITGICLLGRNKTDKITSLTFFNSTNGLKNIDGNTRIRIYKRSMVR